jgi:hypothetical protein
MKRVSQIREGLQGIPGALETFQPDPGFEGRDRSIAAAHVIWPGEQKHDDESDATFAPRPDADETDSDNDLVSEGDGDDYFDPVFELGADAEECIERLGGAAGVELEQSVLLHGMDALGWYVSFHYTGVQWGIYVPVSGIAYLVSRAFGPLSASLGTKVHLAFHAILNHELFHFAADYAIAQAELTHREPWVLPARRAFRAKSPRYCVLEEKLANAQMLLAFRSTKAALRVKGKQAVLRQFVQTQPEGYCDALGVRPEHMDSLLSGLARCYGEHAANSKNHSLIWGPKGFDWAQQFPIRPRIDWHYCPIHLVNDGSRYGIPQDWLSCFTCLASIEESDSFREMLHKLSADHQDAWKRMKEKLRNGIPRGADFKKWQKGGANCYSVRITSGFRAHLIWRRDRDSWLAITIGSHTAMGHD